MTDKLKEYNINFNSLDNILNEIVNINSKKLFIIDNNVYELYQDELKIILSNKNDNIYIFILESYEKNKSLKTIYKIYEILNENNFIKTDKVVAIGGGIVTDISGFLASTYLRGIELIYIPTTLLSIVDSSIGGKNAVNFNNIKNNIGTIYNPQKIYIDLNFLKTLKVDDIYSGLGEIIKYSLIYSDEFYVKVKKFLEQFNYSSVKSNDFERIIKECIRIKIYFIEKDRIYLNFGHTIAHGIEAVTYNKIPHGVAVLIGMKYTIKYSFNNLSNKKNEIINMIDNILNKYFKNECDYNFDAYKIIEYIKHDKKREDKYYRYIFIDDIAKMYIEKITEKEIIRIISE